MCIIQLSVDVITVRHIVPGWWSGVVVSALASINEVNLRRALLVLRWATVSGFNSRCRTFISACNQPATQGELSLPSVGGSVNEYQLRPGRQRQVWFIPLADDRGVYMQVKLRSLSALEVCLQQGAIQIYVCFTLPYHIIVISCVV